GTFLDSLGALVGKDRIVLVVTADHGVTSFPERLAMKSGMRSGRLSLDGLARATSAALSERFLVDFGVEFRNGVVSAGTPPLQSRGVSVDSLSQALVASIRASAGIAAAYSPRTLAGDTTRAADQWRHAIPPDVAWLVCVVPKPGYVWSSGKLSAEHGTVNDD